MSMSRRRFLVYSAGPIAACLLPALAAPAMGADGLRDSRRLRYEPPALRDPLVITLDDYDGLGHIPGWDAARQQVDPRRSAASSPFPDSLDIVVVGKTTGWWTGAAKLSGGRRVMFLGGAYRNKPYIDDYEECAVMEGLYILPVRGGDDDALSMRPSTTARRSADAAGRKVTSYVLNCFAGRVMGHASGGHGDAYQLPGSLNTPPHEVYIDKYLAICHYQGLMLAPQLSASGASGDGAMPDFVRIGRVVMKKGRAAVADNGADIALFYPIDGSARKHGNRAYPKILEDLTVVPWRDEGMAACLSAGGMVPGMGVSSAPRISADGRSATYDPAIKVRGQINYSTTTPGVVLVSRDGRGGLGVPGFGYQTPGY